jgi:prephenate dehydrogenase
LSIAEFRRIAIVGAGLIGGSLALAVRERDLGADVCTLDRNDDLGLVADADLIILAAPITENIRILQALRSRVLPGTIITDTGSTKVAIVAAANGLRFVGGHPVAGAAASGRSAAREDLFEGRPWVLTPTPSDRVEDVARLRTFLERIGGIVHLLSPDAHDRLFALISHLPQLVVSALMDVVGSAAGENGLTLAGQGLRDTTRLAASPAGIWRDIVQTNHENIATSLDALIAALTALRDDSSGDLVTTMFERAARWKQALEERSI